MFKPRILLKFKLNVRLRTIRVDFLVKPAYICGEYHDHDLHLHELALIKLIFLNNDWKWVCLLLSVGNRDTQGKQCDIV